MPCHSLAGIEALYPRKHLALKSFPRSAPIDLT